MFALRQVNQKTVTPMQWSKEANAGFTTGTPWLQPNAGYIAKNLDVSLGMGGSCSGSDCTPPFLLFPLLGGVGGCGFTYSCGRLSLVVL